jgi:hypothetical protein
MRYVKYFEEQADKLMPEPSISIPDCDVRDNIDVRFSALQYSFPYPC